jgi:hypothetical protein
VILLTPPPVNTHQRRADLESRNPPLALDRLFDTTQSYAKAVQEVGDEQGVTSLDVWTLIWEAANRDEAALDQFLVDGLHLNGAGHQVSDLSVPFRTPPADTDSPIRLSTNNWMKQLQSAIRRFIMKI